VYYKCQFDETVQLTKISGKKMSVEVVFETVESRSLFVEVHPVASSMQRGRHARKPVLRPMEAEIWKRSLPPLTTWARRERTMSSQEKIPSLAELSVWQSSFLC